MQPTLCARCKKNIAVVFLSRMEGDKTIHEGLCLKCAKSLGIPQVDETMKRMGITDEDLDNLNSEMLQIVHGVENPDEIPEETEDEDESNTATFPFLNRLFNAGERREQPPAEEGRAPENGERGRKNEKKTKNKNEYMADNYHPCCFAGSCGISADQFERTSGITGKLVRSTYR